MSDDNFLEVAKEAAQEAGKIIAKYFGEEHDLQTKMGDSSDFATKADGEAEEKIVEILTKNFPDHNIIAEEKTRRQNGSEYTWVIDPLDGTVSFAAGLPFFSVSIGLLKNNMPCVGVIYDVLPGDLYTAEIGKGAFLNGNKMKVSRRADLSTSVIDTDLGHRLHREEKVNKYFLPLINKVSYIYSIGSTMTLAYVGRGNFDGYVSEAWIWDYVAGAVIIREAGGKVTDFSGNEPDWTRDRLTVVASNGLIHGQILEALRK